MQKICLSACSNRLPPHQPLSPAGDGYTRGCWARQTYTGEHLEIMAVVLALMSGGVDSSVAAALLKEQGHELIGVTMRQVTSADGVVATSGCCSYADIRDAKRMAWTLGIDHYAIDIEKTFRERVIQPFIDDYAAGRTPNPCVNCNREVRFEQAFALTKEFGAEFVATGHYVRSRTAPGNGRTQLLRGVDPSKDQSYFLSGVSREYLDRLIFPIGQYTKPQVRELAERFQLPVASKPDSQEICFTIEGDVHDFLAAHGQDGEGEIVDTEGNVLGTHRGISHYTIGQRQGLGLAGGPWYVTALDAEQCRVIVGRREDLAQRAVQAKNANILEDIEPGEMVTGMIRSQMKPQPCCVDSIEGGNLAVTFSEPLYGVAPGQALVLYRDDLLLAGGEIVETKES